MSFELQSEHFFKVVLIGAPGVGKTSILERFVEDKFSQEYKTTIGADFRTKDISIDNKTVLLQIWDTAGQERFRALAAPFYRGANICVLVFDVSQQLTFDAIEQWRDEFLHHSGAKITSKEVENWMKDKEFNMKYIETSALKDENIQDAFEIVGKLCLSHFSKHESQDITSVDEELSQSQSDDLQSDHQSNISLSPSILTSVAPPPDKDPANCLGGYCQLL